MSTAAISTTANQSGRHALSISSSRFTPGVKPLSLVRHLSTQQISLFSYLRIHPYIRSTLYPTAVFSASLLRFAIFPPFTSSSAWRSPFHDLRCRAPPTLTGSRRFSTQPSISSNLLRFNRTRRKNVSYFRGRSPWRSASQLPRPSKPDPLATRGPSGQNGASRNLLNRLPDLSHRFHRPSKEELLAAATGFWSRLRVRFKWFSIRSLRPFNMDDISAFFSWLLVGHVVWILVGTTTFFSLAIFAVNTVFAQGKLLIAKHKEHPS